MLKNVLLATAAVGLVLGIAAPTQAAEGQMTCREAAKMKHADDMNAQRAYMQECRAAWKSSQQAAKEKPAEPTYAGDL
jgi:hypothetical protein